MIVTKKCERCRQREAAVRDGDDAVCMQCWAGEGDLNSLRDVERWPDEVESGPDIDSGAVGRNNAGGKRR
jgi:hypothetical protein